MNFSEQDQEYLKKLKLLYVDDEEPARVFLQQILMRKVGAVITAKDGNEGISLYHSHHPHIVITDICMPGMDGLSMAQEIRSHDNSVPIIVITAFEQTDFLMQAIDIGIDCYVTKPIMIERLMKALLHCAHQLYTEERLHFLSLHDALTELPNRTLLQDRLAMACATADRTAARIAMLFIDLDHFKAINDTYGHIAGDQVLQEVARRLQRLFRSVDTVCRLSGDEFLVLLTGIANRDDVSAAAQKMVAAIGESMDIEGEKLAVSASVGIALYPKDGEDMETLIRNSDSAMYASKQRGGNSFSFYAG